ncbi:MAG: F0F1 ATP synthase subunit B [Planctomycetes bacterium]|nr:F0F1 ATP synthase subunit B [Planctomycetota bacterium]
MNSAHYRLLTLLLLFVCAFAPGLAAAPAAEAEKHGAEKAGADAHHDDHGAHLAPGEPGDHHAVPKQKSVTDLLGSVMFWEYICFGILLLILGGFVFPKLFKQLDARQKNIKDALDKAEQVRIEAEVLLKKHEEMMRRSHEDAKKITDEAVAAGRNARAAIEQAANAAAQEIKERAQREVEQLSRKAEAELREAAVLLALEASGRVLGRALTGEDHKRLAREAVDAAAGMRN